MANQSGIASRKGSKLRLRMGEGVYSELSVFMCSRHRWWSNRRYCACVGFCNTTFEL